MFSLSDPISHEQIKIKKKKKKRVLSQEQSTLETTAQDQCQ